MFTPKEIIEHCKKFCTGWDFVEVSSVEYCNRVAGGEWCDCGPRARITVNMNATPGVIAHEIFHSVFHNSPLHANSESWGDGFCEAYRWLFVEQTDLMRANLGTFKHRSDLATNHQLCYMLPADAILADCQYNRNEFTKLFQKLNVECPRHPEGFLSRRYRFTPGIGFTA